MLVVNIEKKFSIFTLIFVKILLENEQIRTNLWLLDPDPDPGGEKILPDPDPKPWTELTETEECSNFRDLHRLLLPFCVSRTCCSETGLFLWLGGHPSKLQRVQRTPKGKLLEWGGGPTVYHQNRLTLKAKNWLDVFIPFHIPAFLWFILFSFIFWAKKKSYLCDN